MRFDLSLFSEISPSLMTTTSIPRSTLDLYVGRLHSMAHDLLMPEFSNTVLTELLEFDQAGLPVRAGELFSVVSYRNRFSELEARGWPWINLSLAGIHGNRLLVHVEVPNCVPIGARYTSVNLSGPSSAAKTVGYVLSLL